MPLVTELSLKSSSHEDWECFVLENFNNDASLVDANQLFETSPSDKVNTVSTLVETTVGTIQVRSLYVLVDRKESVQAL